MLTVMFPGQGSQEIGMGSELFSLYPDIEKCASDILGFDIKEMCLEDPNKLINKTQYTQPCLYVVNAMSYRKWQDENTRKPDYLAGHSLGEFNALLAANVFNFETGLKIVKKRGELMGKVKGGAMAAVLGLEVDKVLKICRHPDLVAIDVANINAPTQLVISGPVSSIKAAESIFQEEEGSLFIPLPVSAAFHSREMRSVSSEFSNFLQDIILHEADIPVISNVTAKPYLPGEMKDVISQQIFRPVQWVDSINWLLEKGCLEYFESGPKNVLSKLVAQIKQEHIELLKYSTREADVLHIDEHGTGGGGGGNTEQSSTENDTSGVENFPIRRRQTIFPMREKNVASRSAHSAAISEVGTRISLGSAAFKTEHNLQYAYIAGSMSHGVSSKEMVLALVNAGMMGFLGTHKMPDKQIRQDISYLQTMLGNDSGWGVNLVFDPYAPDAEEKSIDLYLNCGVKRLEIANYVTVTPQIVRYRYQGVDELAEPRKILIKTAHPDVAAIFMAPAPSYIIDKLLAEEILSEREAYRARNFPMAEDICAMADSGWYTSQCNALTLLPSMLSIRDSLSNKTQYSKAIRVGLGGGVGCPKSIAAAFLMGADFVQTGSINQSTVEANTSDLVKKMLASLSIQDMGLVPGGNALDRENTIQVVKKGTLFPMRARNLIDSLKNNQGVEYIDASYIEKIENKYFKRRLDDVWVDVIERCVDRDPGLAKRAEKDSKLKLALIFNWYFEMAEKLTIQDEKDRKVDYCIYSGPAQGVFNQWAKGTVLSDWPNRHVAVIAKKLMEDASLLLQPKIGDTEVTAHTFENEKVEYI
ncbi:ACP S-malonyltransferase [Pseudomonadota bacterium]